MNRSVSERQWIIYRQLRSNLQCLMLFRELQWTACHLSIQVSCQHRETAHKSHMQQTILVAVVCTPSCVNGDCTDRNNCTCDEGWFGATCKEKEEEPGMSENTPMIVDMSFYHHALHKAYHVAPLNPLRLLSIQVSKRVQAKQAQLE